MTPSDPRRGATPLGVLVTDTLGRRARDPGVARWLRSIAPRSAAGHISIVLASDAAVRQLNRQYAGTDRATDVLSFPGDESAAGQRWLGDVVIARGVSRRQARNAGHSWLTELRILALHGLLHLLGYDHGTDRGEMARLERRLRRKGGLDEALIERASRRPGPHGGALVGAPRPSPARRVPRLPGGGAT